ncbi:MAG: ABC transporter ATP-binding protein [Elusimicrobiota bacterium]
MEKVVVFLEVSKTYKKSHLFKIIAVEALRKFNLEIFKGEIIGILGLNGAGKTTAMKLLCGLLRHTAGRITVFGFEPESMDAKSSIGFLPEFPYFYPYLTPVESLDYYARLSGVPHEKIKSSVHNILEKVGLKEHLQKKISEFSKGMMQRLGVAQAIIHNPELIVLDEPVSGLDPLAIHDIRLIISQLNKDGKTIFLSSHSISELEKISNRVVIIVKGEIAKIVNQTEWKSNPGGLESIFVETVKQRIENI